MIVIDCSRFLVIHRGYYKFHVQKIINGILKLPAV